MPEHAKAARDAIRAAQAATQETPRTTNEEDADV